MTLLSFSVSEGPPVTLHHIVGTQGHLVEEIWHIVGTGEHRLGAGQHQVGDMLAHSST